MWMFAKNGDKDSFAELVVADTVMVCGGYRYTGAEYTEFIGDFGISAFEIRNFEVVHETAKTVQVHYIVKTTANSSENADLSGLFHVAKKHSARGWVKGAPAYNSRH